MKEDDTLLEEISAIDWHVKKSGSDKSKGDINFFCIYVDFYGSYYACNKCEI